MHYFVASYTSDELYRINFEVPFGNGVMSSEALNKQFSFVQLHDMKSFAFNKPPQNLGPT